MTAIPFQTPRRAARRASFERRHGWVRRFAESALAALRAWRRRARARNELMALDNRTLHDLGLSRCDIPYLVRRAGEPHPRAEGLPFPPL
jgi:uncharacterized protein YjiS (DUF1127 family)